MTVWQQGHLLGVSLVYYSSFALDCFKVAKSPSWINLSVQINELAYVVDKFNIAHFLYSSSVKPIDKREGAGAHNWGTMKDDIDNS